MDKIEKLLKKISLNDRQRLIEIMEKLILGKKAGLDIKKLKNSDFYRLRSGRFRIIFHKVSKEIIVDSIKLRNDNTYKI
ncbi:MAG TPA: type II toxin-antitoxin system RelE/ParE family toxin [Candidatus Magasanikbacteria bacterium]|nr:type II toxin-antitoxin system RelE/ParE family toxin [Candidatus Magasanikbacteria bacterium]